MNNTKEALKYIEEENEKQEARIKYLQEEVRKLREEYDKDEEVSKLKAQIKEMKEEYYRGFPISQKEAEAISEWKLKHEIEDHGLTTDRMRMKAQGCCGGRYTYRFVPTSIGTSGSVVCSCGKSFEFQKIE